MGKTSLSGALLLLVVAVQVADARGSKDNVVIDAQLEQRVVEELAARGTVLSKLGVELELEAVGDKLIVSLIDQSTHKAVASTSLDDLPEGRRAALKMVTRVADGLAAQLDEPSEDTATSRDDDDDDRDDGDDAEGEDDDDKPAPRDRKGDRAKREAAERKFRQEALGFGDGVAVSTDGKSTSVMTFQYAYQGELKRPLETPEFFRIVGRNDLADSFTRRRRIKIGLLVGGTVGFLAGTVVALKGMQMRLGTEICYSGYPPDPAADAACDQRNADQRAAAKPYLYAGIGLSGVGLIAMMAPLFFRTSPVDNRTYYELAASHNEKLRRKYGLATASSERGLTHRVHDVVVTPYASADGGGLAMMGRF